ncbi:hypothetical protein P7B02_03125 [Caulobacter segnis]|uniref:hypothetical protein n=1 Tax=Caulobacter segnis TaxID=88688 RepID=UPI00240F0CE7|nr:hypothetical protein [Caulobacter segnis]MDG2520522.1 hypothetical protein [Caulobacter segnis]
MAEQGGADLPEAAQAPDEVMSFVEAFAKVKLDRIRAALGSPMAEAASLEAVFDPDWDDADALSKSGLEPSQIDADARAGRKYLHFDVAADPGAMRLRELFLGLTGLSEKQQRVLFPVLRGRGASTPQKLTDELTRLNGWLDEMREGGFDPSAFITYQRSIAIHGAGQNLSGQIGAAGAAIAFVDAIQELNPTAIADTVGAIAPSDVRSPAQVAAWLEKNKAAHTLRAVLLTNGRALVFAGSKDANIFEPLGGAAFLNAKDALQRYNAVAKDQRQRRQQLHEHAVGEVKTATDPNNLHERMGLASRETQTELRTDRFLMMAILNPEILAGGEQGRTMNNRDLIRFTHVFNLHHCWGWDGGRERHPEHWTRFKDAVAEWCGL